MRAAAGVGAGEGGVPTASFFPFYPRRMQGTVCASSALVFRDELSFSWAILRSRFHRNSLWRLHAVESRSASSSPLVGFVISPFFSVPRPPLKTGLGVFLDSSPLSSELILRIFSLSLTLPSFRYLVLLWFVFCQGDSMLFFFSACFRDDILFIFLLSVSPEGSACYFLRLVSAFPSFETIIHCFLLFFLLLLRRFYVVFSY